MQLKKLSTDTLVYGVGNIASRFINLLLLPFYTRYLTPEDYGVLAILGTISLVGQQIFSFGLGASLGMEYFKSDQSKRHEVINNALFILFCSATLFFCLNIAFNNTIRGQLFNVEIENGIINLNALFVGLQIIIIPLASNLQFQGKSRLYTIISITTLLITIITSIIFVVHLKYSAVGIIVSSIIGQVFSLIIYVITYKFWNSFVVSKRVIVNILKQGIPLIPSFISLFIISQSNRFFLQSSSGIHVVGIYSVGSNFGMVMSVFVGAFTTAWYPFFMSYSKDPDLLKPKIKLVSRVYLVVFGALTILFFSCSRPLVFLMDPSFRDSYYVIGFVAMSQFLIGFHAILLPVFYFTENVLSISLIQIIAASFSVLINYLFISSENTLIVTGVLLMISYLFIVIIQYFWTFLYKEKLWYELDWGFIIPNFILVLIIGLFSILIKLTSLANEVFFAFISFVLVIFYIYYYFLSAYKQNYISVIKSIFNKKNNINGKI